MIASIPGLPRFDLPFVFTIIHGIRRSPKIKTGRAWEHSSCEWRQLLVLTGKKLTFKFSTYIFEYRPLPPTSTLVSTYVMNAPRPSRFLPVFHVLLWMETEGKNGGGLGTRLNIIPLAVFFASLHIACSSNFSVCTTELLYNTYICRSVIKWISP